MSADNFTDLMPNFLAQAVSMAERGIPISLIPARQKGNTEPGWQDSATNNVEEIIRRADHHSNLNYGCVAKACPDGFLFLDDDGGIKQLYEEEYPFESGAAFSTLTAQSCNGSFHYYFKHSPASLAYYHNESKKAYIGESNDKGGELWSLRIHNAYVVGPGSIVPNKQGVDSEYKIVLDVPVINIPDKLLMFLVKRYKAQSLSIPLTASLHGPTIPNGMHDDYLTSVAGKLRDAELDKEMMLPVIINLCGKRCDGHGSDYVQMCEKIVHSVCKYSMGEVDDDIQDTYSKSTWHLNGIWVDGPSRGKRFDGVEAWRSSFRTVSELQDGPIVMLIDKFLQEGTTFIGGPPGNCKTLLGLSITKALTTGRKFLGVREFNVPKITPVLYLIPESGDRAFRKRCTAFGIPNDDKLFLCRTLEQGLLDLEDSILIEAVRTMKPVVILDTMVRFNKAKDENDSMQNNQITNAITRLRQMGAIGVIAFHHATKSVRDRGMSLETVLRGTGDISAYPDNVYGLMRDEKLYANGSGPNEIDVQNFKSRDDNAPAPFRIAASRKTTGGLTESVIDATGDFGVVQRSVHQAETNTRLAELVEANPEITLEDLREATGVTRWEISKRLGKLGWMKPRGGRNRGWIRAESEA